MPMSRNLRIHTSTGTPEVGGLTPVQALEVVRGCRGLNLIGGDVVEVCFTSACMNDQVQYDFEAAAVCTLAGLVSIVTSTLWYSELV